MPIEYMNYYYSICLFCYCQTLRPTSLPYNLYANIQSQRISFSFFLCCLQALNCSLAWIHYGAHVLEKFVPSFLIARATHSLCVFLGMKLNIIRIICIRITNLCDSSGDFLGNSQVSPTSRDWILMKTLDHQVLPFTF